MWPRANATRSATPLRSGLRTKSTERLRVLHVILCHSFVSSAVTLSFREHNFAYIKEHCTSAASSLSSQQERQSRLVHCG